MTETTVREGITRRELLKRGALVGGAVVWAAPVVQLIGMTPAMASHVSELCICVKLDGCSDEGFWDELGGINPGNCLDANTLPAGCDNQFQPDSTFVVGKCTSGADEFCIEFNVDNTQATLFFPPYCKVTRIVQKAGQNDCFFTVDDDNGLSSPFGPFTIEDKCSHIEFCFQC